MATSVTSVLSLTATALSSTSSPTSTNRATPQAGILEGSSPVVFDTKNPIILFIIQAGIVIILCQLLTYPLRLVNQPRVIAEVIGGILLGPSVMSRIPGFQAAIFPTASMPVFNAIANLGLILFLFLVGLEVDIRMFTSNWRIALSVGVAGMLLPFGLGFAIAKGIYDHYHGSVGTVPISFGVFGLFIGTAMAITAFPVLCRILTELKLLGTNVGVSTLAAGVGNDVTGWILLALCVALVNNASGLAALWALLCVVGWALFLTFIVRPPLRWVMERTGSIQNGPTQSMVALTVLLVITSAWFTGIVGVHPVFGAFLIGLICPHDGGFAIKLTEKIEDLVSVLFLPLYFAMSGLSTNLGLLNDGVTWGYVIGVIVCAFAGKIIGGTLAARSCKLLWRESATIGVLMSCKGLVELIVLNVGLSAGILSQTTFTMFVVMALVTTVATTPIVKWLYPTAYQQKVDRWRRGEIDWNGNLLQSETSSQTGSAEKLTAFRIRRLSVYLRLDSLPSLFTFINLLGIEESKPEIQREPARSSTTTSAATIAPSQRPLEVHGIRILELTERTSSVMHVTEGERYFSKVDPVVNAFRTFSRLNDVAVSGRVAVVPTDSYADTLIDSASEVNADFVLLPWSEHGGNLSEDQSGTLTMPGADHFTGRQQFEFLQRTMQKALSVCNAGVFINSGFGGSLPPDKHVSLDRTVSTMSTRQPELPTMPLTDKSHHVFLPFFGGADDQAALQFVLQLAKNPNVTLTIMHFIIHDLHETDNPDAILPSLPAPAQLRSSFSRMLGKPTKDEMESDQGQTPKVIDEVAAQDLALLAAVRKSPPDGVVGRITVTDVDTTAETAAWDATKQATELVGKKPDNAGDIVVTGRRHPAIGDQGIDSGYDLKRTIGVLGNHMIISNVKASVLVIQSGGRKVEH